MPRWVDAREDDAEEEEEPSSEEDEDEEGMDQEVEEPEKQSTENEEPGSEQDADDRAQSGATAGPSGQKQKILIPLGNRKLVCHVCKKIGHCAGFVGSVYYDCPFKPCYLCKQTGHTTMTCPYRIAPEHGCVQATNASSNSLLATVLQRESNGRKRNVHLKQPTWQVDAAVLKLHSRRCCCLDFHPTKDNIVVSGDKKGQVAVWDFDKVHERTVYGQMHRALTNNIRSMGPLRDSYCASASTDGILKVWDIETGFHKDLLNMNPGGWTGEEKNWIMLYGLDVGVEKSLIVVGDSKGKMYFVDSRSEEKIYEGQLHKKGMKVTSCHVNPVNSNLLMSSSNDWTAKIFDMRKMSISVKPDNGKGKAQDSMQLVALEHPKVVNSAYFSPISGGKILTTCIDNRIRVWDYVLSAGGPPDREIVHSHDFNRYLTPFRAEWDPKDPAERTVVVGRYISEDFGGVALHPVDILDASTGRLLSQLVDANLSTICPVNKPHPRVDVIVSGSSRSLYAWRPVSRDEDDPKEAAKESKEAKGKGKSTGLVPSSAYFVSFDADDTTEKKKRKAAGIGESPPEKAKAKKAAKSKVVEDNELDEEDEPEGSKGEPSKGKKLGGRKK